MLVGFTPIKYFSLTPLLAEFGQQEVLPLRFVGRNERAHPVRQQELVLELDPRRAEDVLAIRRTK